MEIHHENRVVSIAEIRPNAYNPKPDYSLDPHLQGLFEKLKMSLKTHGQVLPLLVRETDDGYELVNGEHRYYAALDLGVEDVEIKNLGRLTREQAIKIALATEVLSFPLDSVLETQLLQELKVNDSLEGLPYDMEEIDTKLELLDFNFESTPTDPKADVKSLKHVTCPECGHSFTLK